MALGKPSGRNGAQRPTASVLTFSFSSVLLINPANAKVLNGPSTIPAKPYRVFNVLSIFPLPTKPITETVLSVYLPTK